MFANSTRNANGYFVRNANWNSLAYGNRLLLANWYANSVSNLLADVFANIAADGVGLSLALRNHGAGSVANVFGALFANPVGYAVVNSSSVALGDHTASGIVDGALTALGNHTASGIVYSAATWFTDIAANVVGHCALTALGNHTACCIVNCLASALRNHGANSIRNRLGYAASLVTYAVDFLGFAGWNPNLLANCAWWALYALNMARTWAVYATALRRVPHPAAWSANGAALYWSSDFFRNRIPVTTVNCYRLGIVNWSGNVANHVSGTSFLVRNHNRVVNYSAVGLLYWVHNRVVDDSFTSFNNWLANRVIDDLAVGLVYRCHDRVVDDLAVRFVHWLVNRVVDLTCSCLSYWTANVVGHLTNFGRIYRSVDRVSPSFGFVNRSTYSAVHCSVTSFLLHASHIDYLVFGNRLVLGACSLLCLLFVNRSVNGFHHSVCGRATAVSNRASTAFVTCSATISGVGFTRGECY